MARRIIVYRDYRPGAGGKFTTKEAYNRSLGQEKLGKTRHIHREYINRHSIESVSDLFDIQDDDGLEPEEYHGTGDTGGE